MSLSRCVWLSVFFSLSAGLTLGQTNVANANYGNDRTNANPNETTLTHAAVGGGAFGKLGAVAVDGEIYAQPLYVGGLQIPRRGQKNAVFVATMNNSVYAIDADDPGAAAPLWRVNLGPAVRSEAIPDLEDVNPQVGILSTPAIDVNAQVIYVVAETFENRAPVFRLHALSLLDGHEAVGSPVAIAASVAGSGSGALNGAIHFDPFWHLQRPGLALANGDVYICFGSHGDAGNYHGWVIAYNASTLQQTAVFNVTPNGNGGGIWQSGRAPMVDGDGNLYVISGNGDFDAASNFSGAVLKLSGANLSVLDWYTPAHWQYLNANDLDVGSTGAVLSADGTLVFAGDKGGRLITLSSGQLGHIESNPGADEFMASQAGIFGFALWQTDQGALLYEHDYNGYLKAYPVTTDGISSTPTVQGAWLGDSLYQGMAVSSNGSADGILWETTGQHTQAGNPGTLHAWNATDLTEIWNSDMQPADVLGEFAKFLSPLVANGRVFVPTFSNQLVVYGLRPSQNPTPLAPHVSSILNGASFIQDAVAPGEVLAVFGTNLGPATLEYAGLDENGNLPQAIGPMQVLFEGVEAPLLYASANQLGTVVPFAASGTTQIVIQNASGQSSAASLPVVAAAPALFTSSGLGTGQAAALNQDGSVNSAANPAPTGSIVTLYATGLGQTTPAGEDGAVPSKVLPQPELPVSVTICGLPAYVVYAGAAPGIVEGVFQINVRIPPLAEPSSIALVVLQVGRAVSPADVWIAVQ